VRKNMAPTPCARCGAMNDPAETGDQCTACGAGLPERSSAYTDAPAKGIGAGFAARPEEQEDILAKKEQSAELAKAEQAARKFASGYLFAIAAIHMFFGLARLLVVLGMVGGGGVGGAVSAVSVVGLGVFFAALGVWARYQPFPAAIVGLVVYLLLTFAAVALFVATYNPTQDRSFIIVHVMLIIALVLAVRAGYKAHRLRVQNDL
jgi:hypothetical protein